jgi:hypothetical protein
MDILGFFDVEGVGESLSTDLHWPEVILPT